MLLEYLSYALAYLLISLVLGIAVGKCDRHNRDEDQR